MRSGGWFLTGVACLALAFISHGVSRSTSGYGASMPSYQVKRGPHVGAPNAFSAPKPGIDWTAIGSAVAALSGISSMALAWLRYRREVQQQKADEQRRLDECEPHERRRWPRPTRSPRA
jgi:hypothetical protein